MYLPDYNPEARCPKCGFDSVTTKYVPTRETPDEIERWKRRMLIGGQIKHIDEHGELVTVPDKPLFPIVIPEHLLRTCVRCDYQWKEEVIGVREVSVKSEVA